jgi:hypothetical protein
MKFTIAASLLTLTLSSVSAFAPSNPITSSMTTKGPRDDFVGPLNGKIKDGTYLSPFQKKQKAKNISYKIDSRTNFNHD